MQKGLVARHICLLVPVHTERRCFLSAARIPSCDEGSPIHRRLPPFFFFLLNSDTLCEMDASSVARATPAAMAVTTATAAPAFGTASFGKELCVVSRARTTAALEGLLDDDEGNNPEPDDDEGGAAASTPHAAMEPVGLSSSAPAADAGDAQVLEPVAPLSESREEADRRNVLTMIRGEAPAFCSSDRLR